MNRISLLLFLLPLGYSEQAGSLVLTSFPLTAKDAELFTMICSDDYTGAGIIREWHINGSVVFKTTQGQSNATVSSDWDYDRCVSGRLNVSSDATQHNVTLRINSTVNNGSVWECVDNQKSQTSNTKAIYVTPHQTTVAAISTTVTSVITARDTVMTSTGSTDVNVSKTPTPTPTSNYLNTTSATTFTTNTTLNSTSRKPISASGSTTTTTTINTAGASTGRSNTIAIAAGAAGGGVAVIAVVIVAAVCIRKRRRSVEEYTKDENGRDRNPSRSAEMLIESGMNGEDEKVMMDNIVYASSSEVVPAEYSIQGHNQADKDVYTQVEKVKNNADQQEVTDMYAKPHKERKEIPNGDVYAKVNKVVRRERTSENKEDMYAKPQKDKQNPKRNSDAD